MKVSVVGAGVMGAGIAETAARSGCQVTLIDIADSAIRGAEARILKSIRRTATPDSSEDGAEVAARIRYSTNLELAGESEIVIEAIRETIEDKTRLLQILDERAAEAVVVASNTSSIPIARLASATANPGRVVGLHFFNPAPVMPVVELTPTVLSDSVAIDFAASFAESVLGKTVLRTQDRAGFLINALLVPYLLAAIRCLQDGVGTRDEIDAGMTGGCGMPMGPLRLCDFIGLDTMLLVSESLYSEHLQSQYAPPPLLRRHVDAGLLGRKSGRGFYEYASF